MQKLGIILPSLFNNLGVEVAVKLKLLQENWAKIFEDPIRKHTYPKDIKENILLVSVNSSAWLNELIMLKEEFLKKLSPYGIRDVNFKFGRVFRKEFSKMTKRETKKISDEQKDWINDILKGVKNDEIKGMMHNLMTKYLIYINNTK